MNHKKHYSFIVIIRFIYRYGQFSKKFSIPAWKYLQNEGIRSEIYHIISVDSTILQNIQCTDSSCHKSNHQLIPWVTCRGFL